MDEYKVIRFLIWFSSEVMWMDIEATYSCKQPEISGGLPTMGYRKTKFDVQLYRLVGIHWYRVGDVWCDCINVKVVLVYEWRGLWCTQMSVQVCLEVALLPCCPLWFASMNHCNDDQYIGHCCFLCFPYPYVWKIHVTFDLLSWLDSSSLGSIPLPFQNKCNSRKH